MKKLIFILSIILIISTSFSNNTLENLNSDYCDGWNDGFCEGYKDKAGQLKPCPATPPCPAILAHEENTYKFGYNRGFKVGQSRTRK
jgi:hypothetical protein